jgi:single-strand DNA-binding protein
MASLNRIQLIGRVGRDPETRYTSTQTAVASFSLATSERVKEEERTEWHQVSVFGKTAELVDRYVKKGALVYLEGRLQSREYQDKAGQTKKVWEVIADKVTFLDTRKADERTTETASAVWMGNGPPATRPAPSPAASSNRTRIVDRPGDVGYVAPDDDPIPF